MPARFLALKGANPAVIFGAGWQGYTLRGFPWRRLQALAPPRRR